MKKSFLFVCLATFVMASCGSKATKTETATDTISAECQAKKEFMEKWAKFDSLTIEEQEAIVAQRAECFTKCLAKKAECQKDTAKCAAKKAECEKMTEEQKAECAAKKAECEQKKAEMDATWANFANLTLAEKKAFFDKVDACKAEKKGCCKKGNVDGEKKCCKDKAAGEKKECCKKDAPKK
jgi:hypothetical protein